MWRGGWNRGQRLRLFPQTPISTGGPEAPRTPPKGLARGNRQVNFNTLQRTSTTEGSKGNNSPWQGLGGSAPNAFLP